MVHTFTESSPPPPPFQRNTRHRNPRITVMDQTCDPSSPAADGNSEDGAIKLHNKQMRDQPAFRLPHAHPIANTCAYTSQPHLLTIPPCQKSPEALETFPCSFCLKVQVLPGTCLHSGFLQQCFRHFHYGLLLASGFCESKREGDW